MTSNSSEDAERAMGIVVESRSDVPLIVLDGAIDIGCAGELKATLLQQLDRGAAVNVSLESATYLDVTAVQLLWAAAEGARISGGQFGIVGPVPDTVIRGLAEAGFPALPLPAPVS
jgi:anti-anti-sigma factor